MFIIRLAEIRIRIENRYAFIERQCAGYICPGDEYAFSVSASEEDLREEQKNGDFSAATWRLQDIRELPALLDSLQPRNENSQPQ